MQQTVNMIHVDENVAPEVKRYGTALIETLRAGQAKGQTNLKRLNLYLLPKLNTLDSVPIAAATNRGYEDVHAFRAMADRCATECAPDQAVPNQTVSSCVSSCQNTDLFKRVKACADPTWLPF
jgi:hypothetical protein